jgi:hypothetical protein
MRKNNCEVVRRELEELMLDEPCSASASEHLRECAACREFHEKQTRLRQIVGGLGTVSAPADFDFRLRARLASESSGAAFHLRSAYWPFARRGFAMAAMLIVFATGVVLVRNIMNRPVRVEEIAGDQLPVPVVPKPAEIKEQPLQTNSGQQQPTMALDNRQQIKSERPSQTGPRIKRPLVAEDRAGLGANVISAAEPAGASAAFPIDASLQSFRVSLDDGRGNARTISVPTISFGSQRVLPGNQFAPKGVW